MEDNPDSSQQMFMKSLSITDIHLLNVEGHSVLKKMLVNEFNVTGKALLTQNLIFLGKDAMSLVDYLADK